MRIGDKNVRAYFAGKELEGVESVEINGHADFRYRWVTGLVLHPASTSCRPPCGLLILADTEYGDGTRGPQMSLGCQCKTGPLLLLDLMAVHSLRVRSQSLAPSSCSVSEDSGRGHADFGA